MNTAKNNIAVLTVALVLFLSATSGYAATVKRTNFIVDRLSCSSCLSNIAAELQKMDGALGMTANLRLGQVTIDHQDSLDTESIAKAITGLGYPARMEWTASVNGATAPSLAQAKRSGGGCGGGGCSTPGSKGNGTSVWGKLPSDTKVLTRTTMQVGNLSCTSCLANIETALQAVPGTIGMKGYLRQGIIVVDHNNELAGQKVAATISAAGYPARVKASTEIPADKKFVSSAKSSPSAKPAGWNCNGSSGPCNATASSWKGLYNKYFSNNNTQ